MRFIRSYSVKICNKRTLLALILTMSMVSYHMKSFIKLLSNSTDPDQTAHMGSATLFGSASCPNIR